MDRVEGRTGGGISLRGVGRDDVPLGPAMDDVNVGTAAGASKSAPSSESGVSWRTRLCEDDGTGAPSESESSSHDISSFWDWRVAWGVVMRGIEGE